MAEKKKTGRYRRAFFAGLATLLPTVLTIFILTFCYNFLNQNIAKPLTGFFRAQLRSDTAREWFWGRFWTLDNLTDAEFTQLVNSYIPNWVGFIFGLVLVFTVGFIFRGYVGRQAIRMLESWVLRIPLIKVIYPYAKQVTEFFFQEKKHIQYQSCVAIEYPRKGVYSLGFVTSEGFRQVSDAAGTEVVAIFIPSSPTPITGYTVLVPRESVHPLEMTVDEALRFTISGGVILPPGQVPPLALKTRRLEPQVGRRPESTGESEG